MGESWNGGNETKLMKQIERANTYTLSAISMKHFCWKLGLEVGP